MGEHKYTLIRSARRTLAVEITRDGVVVRAPRTAKNADIERFLEDKRPWIEKKLAAISETSPSPIERDFSPDEEKRLRQTAKDTLPGRIEHFSARTGLTPTGITITGARTRFGSCSGRNAVSFSFRLMLYPPEAIDYVVLHELCHIKQKNHSPAFYALVERYMPDWRERRELLRRPR